MSEKPFAHGGALIGDFLARQGVRFLYTLCGGHISPILTGAEEHGIRVIDVRDEASAVFAADATARLTGIPGVAAVTAGPGVTNTLTAVKNAQMAQSPVVLLGGAAPALLQGRGALQDIDQLSLLRPLTKMAKTVRRVADIVPVLEDAFATAQRDVPGPVFVELPINLLYPEEVVRQWTLETAGRGKSLFARGLRLFLRGYLWRSFHSAWERRPEPLAPPTPVLPDARDLETVQKRLMEAQKPVLVVGSQALLQADQAEELQRSLRRLGIPTFLSGMARGLLGDDPLYFRHKRTKAIRESDLVLLAGVPCDFRLQYGQSIPRKATFISINRSSEDLTRNRKPDIGLLADPGATLRLIAAQWKGDSERWNGWRARLAQREQARAGEIDAQADVELEKVNPLDLCRRIEAVVDQNSVLIGDGGDFVATASYIIRPRGPLSWLDPGPFGTLGVGGGFALAAKLNRPSAEVWLLYGDGSAGYTLAEFDTFVRHGVPVIAVVGNDASWAQIARDQVEILGTALGTELTHAAYHTVAEGYGGVGLCVDRPEQIDGALARARELARAGKPVLINVHLSPTDFRKGSISV